MIKYPSKPSLYKLESDFYTQSLYQVIQRTILPNLQHYNGGRKKNYGTCPLSGWGGGVFIKKGRKKSTFQS